MKIEIERQFLVRNDDWRRQVTRTAHLRDGLILRGDGAKLRVRCDGERAFLTFKTPRAGTVRREFEYEIPVGDAELLIRDHCIGQILAKTRHFVEADGLVWTVDVYEGLLHGIVIAEVELEREDQEIALPSWVGAEVTGREEYRKSNMLAAATARLVAGPTGRKM